tara:strand:+ start:270 stop:629 length:360 start_codon:yes stop_codon:yes gene_type:complete
MPSYNFKLILKEKLGMFEKSGFVSNIEDSCVRYNQFIFGRNIKNINVKIDGINVNVSLNLKNDISEKDFDDAVSNIVKLMKKKGYSLKQNKKKKSNTKTKKVKQNKKKKSNTKTKKMRK